MRELVFSAQRSERMVPAILTLGFCVCIGAVWFVFKHPVIPLALAAMPLGILIVLRHPYLVVLGFIVFSFFRIHEVFPQLYPLKIPLLLALASLVTLGWNVAMKRIQIYWSSELTAFALFFCVVTIGVALATNRAEAFSSFTGTYVKIAIMVLAISWMATEEKECALTTRIIMLAGMLVGSVALWNKTHGIGLTEGTRVTIGRDIGSMLGDPNDLALVLLFPASFALRMPMPKLLIYNEM